MRTKITIAALALVATAALPGLARAQDGSDILENALEKYAERAEGIDDYTITYAGFMGSGTFTTYFEKEMVDGFPVFRPARAEGYEGTGESRGWNAYSRFPQLAERAEYEGDETIDGVEAHRVTIDDFEGLDMAPPGPGGEGFEPETMTMWIDGDALIRRMRMEGTATREGRATPVTMVVSLGDYRTVEGMPFPYQTSISAEGAMAASGMSEEEAAEAREKLQQMQEQLDAMPEAQREQMERLMGPRLENLEKMLGSGTMEMTLTVQDVEVNTGPPSES